MAKDMTPDSVDFPGWPKGMNTIKDQHALENDELRRALNVDISNEGEITRRVGRTKVYDGVNIHSLFTCPAGTFFVEAGTLKQLHKDYTASELMTGLDIHSRLSYDYINETVFWSNNQISRCIKNGVVTPWGVPMPPGSLNAEPSSSGICPPGKYQVCATFLNAGGEESGTHLATPVELTQQGGITITNVPYSPDLITRIYVTKPNGGLFFQVAQVASNVGGITINDLQGLSVELETHMGSPPIAGHIVRYYGGRMWVAKGSTVWYSDPMRFGLFKHHLNFLAFPAPVTTMQPSDDTMYIVADRTYAYPGTNPREATQVPIFNGTSVPGTGTTVDASRLGLEGTTGKVGVWFSETGLCFGVNGGQLIHAMKDKIALEKFTSGAVLYRGNESIRQVVTALKGSDGNMAKLGAADQVSIKVIRNGVEIPA